MSRAQQEPLATSDHSYGAERPGSGLALALKVGATAVAAAGLLWGVPWFKGEVTAAYDHLQHGTEHSQPYQPSQSHDPIPVGEEQHS